MHSSHTITNNSENNKKQSSNFRNQILMPTIYDLANYQLIKNNSYITRKERPVTAIKKAKLQAVVETLVAKKELQILSKPALHQHRSERPATASTKRLAQSYSPMIPESLTLDIDEKINEKAMEYEEQNTNQKEKMREMIEKINEVGNFSSIDIGKEELNFYVTEISPMRMSIDLGEKIIVNNTTYQPYPKGYIEEQEVKERRREARNKKEINTESIMVVKARSKSALLMSKARKSSTSSADAFENIKKSKEILFSTRSLMNTRLSRFEQGSEISTNLKQKKSKIDMEISKFRSLTDQIEENCMENNFSKAKIVNKMNKLGMIWKSEKEIIETLAGKRSHEINSDTLKLLISQRKKEFLNSEIDKVWMEESHQKKKNPEKPGQL